MQATQSSPRRPLPEPPLPVSPAHTVQSLQLEATDMPEQVPEKINESLSRLEPQAENEIEEVSKFLDKLPLAHARQEFEDIAKQMVEGVSHVLDYLGAVAQLHPVAGVRLQLPMFWNVTNPHPCYVQIVVGALTKVVNLEKQRHENNAHIVVVHATMVKTVYHVRFLTRIPLKVEEDLEEKLRVIFTHMVGTIREFDKVLFSHIHKEKLEHFNARFQQHREDLDEIRKTLNQIQIATVLNNTEEILRKLRAVRADPDILEAEAFIRENGGTDSVRMDPRLIEQVAGILQEKATSGMKETLRMGFDGVLEKHTYADTTTIRATRDGPGRRHILGIFRPDEHPEPLCAIKLSEGPHRLIEDKEMREIWERESASQFSTRIDNLTFRSFQETSRWKSCVKCRIFIEGLHEYYQAVFHEHGAHRDAWTLVFFSRVMYHSAIGDVIDDDGSGYLSVSEVNNFISEQRCLSHWSTPEWFALYYRNIKHILSQLHGSLHSLGDISEGHRDSWDVVTLIIESLKPLVLVADVEDFSGIVKVPHQLRRLQEEYRSYEERKIIANLAHFGDHLADRTSLDCVVGDTRIELHMMPLLYVLVIRLQGIITDALQAGSINNRSLVAIEELATSCIAIFVAFEDRMRDLIRGWRCEGKDIGMQVDRYADGLFRKLYRETHLFEQPYHTLRNCIFGSNLTMPRHLRPFAFPHRSQKALVVDTLARDLTSLSKRVEVLEHRLSKPEGPRVRRDSSSSTHSTATALSAAGIPAEYGPATKYVVIDPPKKRSSFWRAFLFRLTHLFL
ncbi:hypothetical protein BN946_scf185043.g261 [Trametes cinnabarina]|uniref:EF-hand domain-containing protein n=1 Tax=Pycnoporus cinnabarinus TaxID=5643 RepID=A0A060SPR3_PYCCI|nr:hypothetical protein BN946_scf185043.g261 [Trametes cinnabarina]